MDTELAQQSELPVTLVAAQQLLWVFFLSLPQLVGQQVFLQGLSFVEAFVTGGAGERLDMTGDVVLELVPLVETFVTELAEEPFLFVQLPPALPLQLLLLFFIEGCKEHKH